MMKFRLRELNEANSAMEIMLHNDSLQNEACVGCFWYDIKNKELFGIYSVLASDVPYYYSHEFNCEIKTGRMLHKNIWQKEFYKNKDKRFQGDYTLIPRGRVFEFKKENKESFKIFVGEWINKYTEAKEQIIEEFNLQNQDIEFIIDEHWNIGQGWSGDFGFQ